MHTVFVIFLIIICLLLILIVLVQNSKGGGLASNFSSSNQYMGVRKTSDFLEKATWTLAASLLVFSLLATWTLPKKSEVNKSRVEGQFDNSRLDQPGNSVINLPESGSENTDAQPAE
ncbi:MAG: preprotein translocase subunit SecG [Bacteroidales bacterium]|nr:preprotein translocase subunit SecG [Bacteroidales bacterium]MCB8999171.1 preprotein translocase subunit SecG [Bacteroidales bacterium]